MTFRVLAAGFLVFLAAFLVRTANFPTAFVDGIPQFPPFDDLYHAKRIAFSAAHPFRVLDFDPNRGVHGSLCPWPPLYDMLAGAAARLLGGATPIAALTRAAWFPPLFTSLVAAAIAAVFTRQYGFLTGLLGGGGVALSIYLLDKSRLGTIDHHFLEFPLVLGIIVALAGTTRARDTSSALRYGGLLGAAIACALFVQPALVLAAGVALLGILLLERGDRAPRAAAGFGFALAATLVFLYRAIQPAGYPDNEWFLGVPHAAALLGGAAACAAQLWSLDAGLSRTRSGAVALAVGALTLIAIPGALGAFLGGLRFLGGNPWFQSISEFQPLFFRPGSIWALDLCLLGGGALLTAPMVANPRWRQGTRRLCLVFALAYLAAALSSMRFLAVAAPLLALSGAVVFHDLQRRPRRRLAAAAALLLIAPSLLSIGRALRPSPTIKAEGLSVLRAINALAQPGVPPGKVLARGTWGHLLNVVADRPVLLDNFGIMGGETDFQNASALLLATRESAVAAYAAANGIRFVLLESPLPYYGAHAEVSGLPRAAFEVPPPSPGADPVPTRLMRSSFWWRAYFEGGRGRADEGPAGAPFRSFRLAGVLSDPAIDRRWAVQIWEFVESPEASRRVSPPPGG